MKYASVFHLMANECGRAHAPFILVGGFAVNYYKVTRATDDVDFLMTEEGFEKAKPFLEQAGYSQVMRQHLFARLRREGATTGRESSGLFVDLDILFVDRQTFEGILKEAQEADLQGAKIKVVSLNHLMAMKLHSLKNSPELREDPDLTDLVRLTRINHIDVDSDSFRGLCLKYGTKELHDKITKKVALWKS